MTSPEAHLRITRLKVVNWRNFRDAEVALADRAFFVGPNASGKSNLLDAIRFLRDIVKPIGGGLATAIAQREGIGRLRTLHQKGKNSDVGIEIDIGTTDHPKTWTYQLYFNRAAATAGVRDVVVVKNESISHEGHIVGSLVFGSETRSIDFYTQTMVEQVNARAEFSVLVRFLQSIRYMHIVPQIVRDPKRQADADDPYGGDLLRRIAGTAERTRAARLKRISLALELAVPQFESLEFEKRRHRPPASRCGLPPLETACFSAAGGPVF